MIQLIAVLAIGLIDMILLLALYAVAITHAGEEQNNEKH